MRNFRLTLCYEGTRYRGWQKQGNTPNTIQDRVENLLSKLLNQKVEIAGCGRTDAGVHARRQVCSFHSETDLPCSELLNRIRTYLPEDIGALSLEDVPPRFHARLSCSGKTYRYRIWNSDKPNVFQRRTMLTVPEMLDESAIKSAACVLCGKHDFAAFSTHRPGNKSTIRNLHGIDLLRDGDELDLCFTGDGFLYNMVRIMAGTLIDVGLHRLTAEDVAKALESHDRSYAGPTAPAHGLVLWDITY